jgi:hypothetical protein
MTPKSKQPRPAYHSYLIRCWTAPERLNCRSPGRQRFTVETVSDQPRRRGFDSLAGLLAFLQSELAANDEPANSDR